MRGARKQDKRPVVLKPEAQAAFLKCKQQLVNAALIAHPAPDAEIRLCTDASDYSMVVSLELCVNNCWQPLAFFHENFPMLRLGTARMTENLPPYLSR